jgi:hypothetical protein
MRGTWQTDDHAVSGKGILLLAGVLLLAASGAAAEIATAVVVVLIAVGAVLVLAVAGFAVFLVHQARRQGVPRSRVVPPLVMRQVPGPERPALESSATRELLFHIHGTAPEKVAEIFRRHSED